MGFPNILMICVDHWPGYLLGAEGHGCILTPTLDSLASGGVRFTRAYSATPTCIPARRALMTGTTAQTHGDRIFNETLRMPDVPTLAEAFTAAGYQAYAVGKMHVYPQRNRIGFGDVILNEEGRHHLGMRADDFELFLAAEGYAGEECVHGMCANDYMARPWHLPERCHHTNWTVRETCRMIVRREPDRPALWYMSFNFPHPPLVPLDCYLDMYRDAAIPPAHVGEWAQDFEALPYALKVRRNAWPAYGPREVAAARRAFYALCTHIDHQLRLVIGTLREEGLLDDTIILFTSDHGDMLGNHGLYAKAVCYDDAARVPLILAPAADDTRVARGTVDDRLAEIRDVMPTLLEMAGVPVPTSVEGQSLLGSARRDNLYAEHNEDDRATRMVRDERYKLIYYPVGNRVQLFDLAEDPCELRDLSEEAACAEVRERLTATMIGHFYGDDVGWVKDGRLRGVPDKAYVPNPSRGLNAQRGWRFMTGAPHAAGSGGLTFK